MFLSSLSRSLQTLILSLASILLVAAAPVRGKAVVSSDHQLASQAGAEVLGMGGNAVDAAVAAALAAGVVQPAGSGLGGGGFAIVVKPNEATGTVFDFREMAPSGATRDMYRKADGTVDRNLSRTGGKAVGVFGEPAGLAALHEAHGALTRDQVAAPAIRLAEEGFGVQDHLTAALARTKHAEVKAHYGAGTGVLKQQALAKTLRGWAADPASLYAGEPAAAVVADASSVGGILTVEDLGNYEVKTREPIVVRWRDHTIITMPPPSSGGVVLGQMLRVLEQHDLKALGHNSTEYIHVVSEVMKHAYSDRAHHLGDPDFYKVPTAQLISDDRVKEVRAALDAESHPPEYYGTLIAPPRDGGTQHISVIDSDGMAVALTTTINTSFGSGVVVEALGLVLNNEMDDFAAAPGVPNFFGLIGSEANAVAPGKRPLSSMSPTVVLDPSGTPIMAVGGSGGALIISGTLQALLNVMVFDMDPQQAVEAPRFHHQWQPDKLLIEDGVPDAVLEALKQHGQPVERWKGGRMYSAVQMVYRDDEGLAGGADPRKDGRPAAQ